jgi:hypothetical protein
MVHRREFEGQTLVFGNHGALWGNAMTWWDHDTGSIWSQPLGEAIAGPRKGAKLEAFPVTFTTWGAWAESHPGTLALDAPAGSSGFVLEELVIVVDFGTETAAYPVLDLQRVGVVNDVVAGVEIAVVSDPADPQRWSVLSRRLDAEVVELARVDGQIVDVRTGSVWDPVRGLALSGPLQGDVLNPLPGFTSFPGDFGTFWPEGRVWQP